VILVPDWYQSEGMIDPLTTMSICPHDPLTRKEVGIALFMMPTSHSFSTCTYAVAAEYTPSKAPATAMVAATAATAGC
ncbi:MAG: hypothetical protein ACK51S_01850, partial [Alphaproteobacteria bacterium]